MPVRAVGCNRRDPERAETNALPYNRKVRTAASFLLIVCLSGCNRGSQSNEAVRQGVIDHLVKAGLNVQGMDVKVSNVDFKGKDADATVVFTPKGGNTGQGMSMRYHLQQQGNQWVVTGRADQGANPHGGMAMPQGQNPHGGGAPPPAGGAGKMPSPEDLPPAGKKK